MTLPRVLVAFTVYNGRTVVPRALASLARLDGRNAVTDVLVLDDASPEPGWSAEVAQQCEQLGMRYYRTPRNLGIPRNVNLGLLAAIDDNYDYVVVSNSDVVYSANAVDVMVRAAHDQPRLGAITAWSTNVSIYSLPNSAPDAHLGEQRHCDRVGRALEARFGSELLDIPAGISFAMLIPVRVLRTVGLMDPVFGRGYCEETDWSRRCLAAGLRVTLGLGAFVYHAGGGSNIEAGVVDPGSTTVAANERIIDMRYPDFRERVGQFLSTGRMPELHAQAGASITAAGIGEHGYDLAVGDLIEPPAALTSVTATPRGDTVEFVARYAGFTDRFSGPLATARQVLHGRIGRSPALVEVFDVGATPADLAHALAGDSPVHLRRNYPSRV